MSDHNLYNTLTAPKPAEMSPTCAAWSVRSLACRLQGLLILSLYNLRAKTCNNVDVCTKGGEPAGLLTDPPTPPLSWTCQHALDDFVPSVKTVHNKPRPLLLEMLLCVLSQFGSCMEFWYLFIVFV